MTAVSGLHLLIALSAASSLGRRLTEGERLPVRAEAPDVMLKPNSMPIRWAGAPFLGLLVAQAWERASFCLPESCCEPAPL